MNTQRDSKFVIVVLIVSLCCTPPAVRAAEELPGPLLVQVHSAADGKAIASCTVHVGGRMAVSDATGKILFDGIPAGAYTIWSHHAGYEKYSSDIRLQNGERTPQVISLTPEVLSPMKLKLVEDTTEESVGRAVLRLTPKEITAALEGPLVFSTDGVGTVNTIPVAEGTYELVIEAPGFQQLKQDYVHKTVENPVVLRLKAEVTPMSCSVAVKGEDGKQLSDAEVELWEVYPIARIASAKTDAGGIAVFPNLRLGIVNPAIEDKSMPVTHRAEAVIRAQAAGYVTGLKSVRLQSGGRSEITLAADTKIPEQQSNDSAGSGQPIKLGQTASFKIEKANDEDWFRLDLAEPARVTVEVNECPIETVTVIFDSAGKQITVLNKYAGRSAKGTWDLADGHYSIKVHEWGMNSASQAEIAMKISGETAGDPFEQNNTSGGSRPIKVGQHMRGTLFPHGDRDYFILNLDRPGRVRLESINTPGMDRTVHIYNRAEKHLATLNCYGGRDGVAEWQFEPGDYQVVVTGWGNVSSLDPYDYRFTMMPDDGLDDPVHRPGTRISSVRHLAPPSRIYTTLNPLGDRDVFAVSIPSRGTLHLHQWGPVDLSTRLLDGFGKQLANGNSYGNRNVHYTYPFQTADTVYLEVVGWGNCWSPFPYELRTWFDPAGEMELLQPNDTLKTAIPIELGAMVRDNILPAGDQDWYQLVIDQPGIINVWNEARPELNVSLHNASGVGLGQMNTYWDRENQVNWNVLPGIYYLQVMEWGNNGAASWDYALKATLSRGVPGETAELAKSPAIPLKIGEARPCCIEHVGDVERFRVSIPEKGEYACLVGGPLETTTTAVDIRTGKVFFQFSAYGGRTSPRDFATEGPMELELTVTEWGNNGANIRPNWIMVGPKGVTLPTAPVDWTADPIRPTLVTFNIASVPGVASLPTLALDINADGQPDGTVAQGRPITLEFPEQGLYRVTASGEIGPVSARGEFWVQATGQPVREGIAVMIATPGEGELIEGASPVRVTALSYEGKPIRQVRLAVDGRDIGADPTSPYEFDIPWETLAGGQPVITATAVDTSGKQKTATRNVHVSDYFNLMPGDGAVVTGNDVVVSWDGGRFGSAKVRYRPKGDGKSEVPWTEAVGQNGRDRIVRITDLEAGKAYEFQPLGGTEPGPIRQVTRVKGLAFTQSHYGGTIERDYDQKIPVAVRNHAEEPRTVRLRCELPKEGLLLADFVGDGEKGRPVELGPGEQRVFTLGFSAQDVLTEIHNLPIFIQSEDGFSDQAQVEVRVKLPRVELEWVDITPAGREGLGRTYELVNKGDTLTDLDVGAAGDSLNIQPEVKHGLIKSGQRLRFEVHPKIYEGFSGCTEELQATSIGKTQTITYEGKLKPGEQVFRLNMTAGLDPVTGEAEDIPSAIRAARRLVGQYVSPTTVDWTSRGDPMDTNRDGKPDRWTVVDELNRTQWFGRDTDGDGQVDFAQADVGIDGEIDHSSMLEDGRWKATNLLDAWLEMNFSIPQHRSKYQPHDLDLLVNGSVVGRLEQTIPEGNYRFGLMPTALNWSKQGLPGENQLEINSHFLNYAHYAISSDFQLKTRLLETDTYMIGTSREDALKQLFDSDPGFSVDRPDFSMSSEDLDISPRDGLKKGSMVTISGTVRNLGTGTDERLEVGLFLAIPGTEGKELTRVRIAPPGMMTDAPFEFVWPAAPGNHSMRVVADPDNLFGEANRKNNAAIVNLSVPGEDSPPTLTVVEPQDKLTTDNGNVNLLATATDDAGVIGIEVAVDGGAMKPLYRTEKGFAGLAQLQSGAHTLNFRVTDSGSQRVEEARTVTIKAPSPECRITSPADGAEIDASSTSVQLSASEVDQAAVRVNNGPWLGLNYRAGMWIATIDLPFGPCEIEVVVVDRAGMRKTSKVAVTCTAQPEEEEPEEEEKQEDEKDQDVEKPQDQKQAGGSDQKGQGDTGGKNDVGPQTPGRKPAGQEGTDQKTPTTQTQQDNRKPANTPDGQANRPGGGTANRPGSRPGGTDDSSGGSGSKTGAKQDSAKKQQGQDTSAGDQADEPEDATQEDDNRARPIDIPEENDVIPPPGVEPPASRPSYTPPARTRPSGGQRRAPAGFVYDRQRNDWYCPNRPKIKLTLKPPPGMTREEFEAILKKGPNSPEFKALESKLLAGYWYRNFGKKVNGQTMDKLLLKYKELLLKRCGRLDQADGKLPSFLQSLGFAADDPPSDPAELEAWRNKMKELTEVYWLRLLATEDPATVMQGMKQRAEALGKFDEAAQLQAEAVMQEIQANQKITQDVLEALPYTGEALDLIAAATGESLSGEQLGGWERFFRLACAAGPAALEETLKRSPRAQEALGQFIAATGEMGSNMKNGLLKRIGADVDKFDEMAEGVMNFLTKERRLFGKNADEVVDGAKNAYKQTAEGMEDLAQMEKAKQVSKQSVDELDDLVMKGGKAGDADMEKAILGIQKDKTAQSLLNGSDVPMEVRKKANETIKKIYKDVDAPTMERIAKDERIRKFAQEHGLDPDKMKVDVWNPTNTKGPKIGDPDYIDPDYVKFGRDRDVTYQISGTTPDGRTITLDVDHNISGPIYNDEFYKRCKGAAPADPKQAKEFADSMDQMVTSKWHREAYNTGPDVHIDDWLNNDITPPVARPEDIRDTIMTKSDHWFKQAKDAGQGTAQYSKDMAEGMRQATKQWDNFIAKRAALYGANVPPQLEKAMDIFKQVEKGSISPKQAEHMLQKLGEMAGGVPLTPQKAVERMAHYFEAIEKGPGKTFRGIKTAELANSLEGVRNVSARTDMIDNAYRSGHITGETYRQMRAGSFKLPPSPTPQQKQELKNWAIGAWKRRAISHTERKVIEEQVGSLDE